MFQFYSIFQEYFWFNKISSLLNVYDFNDIFLSVKLYSTRGMCFPLLYVLRSSIFQLSIQMDPMHAQVTT